MKRLLVMASALAACSAFADIAVDGKIPAGNVIVEGIEGTTVRLRQDMRDSNNWFYWAFRVSGAEGKTVKFVFTDPYAGGPVSCRGPVVTKDGGKTWSYPCDGKAKENEFSYSFAADEKEVWFYQTFQYYPWQWDVFLNKHAADRGKVFEAGVLCKSRKGREVPKAVFGRIDGKARYRVWLSSRTHCGEAPATYVLEGWLERVFGKDALGAWLRENVEFMVVPFVDYDGAVDGDQGKGRKPHDHNRDYTEFLYPESKAIADWITERAKCRIDVAFDHHSPWVRNSYNEKIYQTYHGDEWNTGAKRKWGQFVMAHQDGALAYSTADDFPWGFGWNCPKNTANPKAGAKPLKGLGGWIADNVPNLLINSTYEIPFANAKGNVVTPEKSRAFGNASAAALKDFLEEMRPAVRENVVYREEFDRFGNYTEAFNAGAGVREIRSGVLALAFAPKAAGEFRSGCFPIATSPKEKSWTFSFRYRFDSDDLPHEFTLKLLFGDRSNPEVRELTVAEAGSFFGCARPAAPKDGTDGFLPNRQFNKGVIVVKDGAAAFWTYRGGRLVKECETAFPAKPLVGWNLAMHNEKGGQLVFDCAVVTDGTARPYDRGDPTEWLAEPPLATADQWDEFWGKPVTDKEPLPVDFSEQSLKMFFRSPFTNGVETVGKRTHKRTPSVRVSFNAATGTVAKIVFTPLVEDVTIAGRRFGGGKFTNAVEKLKIPSYSLSVGGDKAILPRTVVCTRPPLKVGRRYVQREVNEIYLSADQLPKISEQAFALEAVKIGENRYRVFLQHNVLCELETPAPVVSIGFDGFSAEAHGWTPSAPKDPDPQVYKLPVQAGGFKLERVRENQGTAMLECNAYLSRDAFDAMPSSCLFNVPKRNWIRAKAKCRVDPTAPLSAVPVITARLTHFFANGGRSIAMCEQTVDLRDANAAVVKTGDDYEITFDFNPGELQDLIAMNDGMARRPLPYLHFEFTGPTWEKNNYYMDPKRSPAEELVSNLIVYSGSLEASPADLTAVANMPFSLYYPDEQAGATVTVNPRVPGEYSVAVEVKDETGKIVEKKVERVERKIVFEAKEYGYYDVDYILRNAKGEELMRHTASFGRIRPDTRKAGYESPYYSWNFRGAHGTPNKMDDWAIAYTRLGIRRTTLLGAFTGGNNQKLTENSPECKKYGFTHVQFPHLRGKNQKGDPVAERKELCEMFPHCPTALIFHESGFGPFPKEIYGETTEVDDAVRAADSNKVAAAMASAKAWRAANPDIKLIHGNSSSSIGLIARLMRGGYPKELADAWGEESVGMSEPPEMSTALLPWEIKKLARHYGYTEAMDCPREWKSRYYPWRYETDKTPAAAMLLKDALIAHALRYTVIPVGASTETANSYADSIWCSGTFSRWPMVYPRKAALGVATLTQLLDCAKFVRMVPTGSLTAYALEFETAEGFTYVLWTSRGETDVAVGERASGWMPWRWFDSSEIRQISMTGRELGNGADGRYAIDECPTYLLTERRIESFAVNADRKFPRERYAGMAKAVTLAPLKSADEAELVLMQDKRVEIPFAANPRRVGTFTAKTVQDGERGSCIELTHVSKHACPEVMMEYCTLRLKEPQTSNLKPQTSNFQPSALGVWVKGNSNWGKVFLEFVDAEGETWFSCGIGGVGCNSYDWPGLMGMGYDGWNFLQLPLTRSSPVKNHSPGDHNFQWTRDGSGNGKIDFPIKVTAVTVGQYGRTLNLLEMEEGSPSVRIGPVQAW